MAGEPGCWERHLVTWRKGHTRRWSECVQRRKRARLRCMRKFGRRPSLYHRAAKTAVFEFPKSATKLARRGRADHGDRIDQEPEGDHLRRRRLGPARAGVERNCGTRDASRRLQRRGEGQGPSLEPLRRCLDAVHAAHHLERPRAARRAVARICGLARLFAEKLFEKVRIGTRVIISPSDAEPVEFSHPALFVPKSEAIAAAPARAETLAREADEATKLAQQTKNAAALAVKEAAPLTAALRKLELAKTRADAALAVAEKALAAAKTDQAKARAEDQKQKAAAKVEELQTQLDAAKANAKSKLDAAAAAQDAAKAAETKKADAAKAASEAQLALAPVSVFISRATQKLYVRRNTHKRLPDRGEVFDATIEVPVTIRNPDKPIGTHVFTAVARADGGLRWTAVTIDSGDVAKAALDRITLPQDVLDRITPTALPRSSLIISDEPLHRETNYRTEFVIALNNQPQGGIINRPRSPDIRVGFGWGGWGFNNNRNYYQRPQRWW